MIQGSPLVPSTELPSNNVYTVVSPTSQALQPIPQTNTIVVHASDPRTISLSTSSSTPSTPSTSSSVSTPPPQGVSSTNGTMQYTSSLPKQSSAISSGTKEHCLPSPCPTLNGVANGNINDNASTSSVTSLPAGRETAPTGRLAQTPNGVVSLSPGQTLSAVSVSPSSTPSSSTTSSATSTSTSSTARGFSTFTANSSTTKPPYTVTAPALIARRRPPPPCPPTLTTFTVRPPGVSTVSTVSNSSNVSGVPNSLGLAGLAGNTRVSPIPPSIPPTIKESPLSGNMPTLPYPLSLVTQPYQVIREVKAIPTVRSASNTSGGRPAFRHIEAGDYMTVSEVGSTIVYANQEPDPPVLLPSKRSIDCLVFISCIGTPNEDSKSSISGLDLIAAISRKELSSLQRTADLREKSERSKQSEKEKESMQSQSQSQSSIQSQLANENEQEEHEDNEEIDQEFDLEEEEEDSMESESREQSHDEDVTPQANDD